MKKIILIGALFIFQKVEAQDNKQKDTVKVDSTQIEKIKKMPMDSISHPMPVAPVPKNNEPQKDAKKEHPLGF